MKEIHQQMEEVDCVKIFDKKDKWVQTDPVEE